MMASLSDFAKISHILSCILLKNCHCGTHGRCHFLPVTKLQDGKQSAHQALVQQLKEDYAVGAGLLMPFAWRNPEYAEFREPDSLDIQYAVLPATWFGALSAPGSRDMRLEWFQLDFS